MRIGIDALSLGHPFNGIGQVTAHLLAALEQLRRAEPLPAGASLVSEATRSRFAEVVGTACEFYVYTTQHSSAVLPPGFVHRPVRRQFDRRSLAPKWWEVWQLPRAVHADRCDVFLSTYQSAAIMPRSIPHLMIVHDIIHAARPEWMSMRPLARRLAGYLTSRGIRRATHCLAVSHFTKRELSHCLHLPDAQSSVAHIAADPVFARTVPPEETDAVLQKYGLAAGFIYHGGGFSERKNARGVLEAYAWLLKEAGESGRVPSLVISGELIRGTRYAEELEGLVRKLGMEDRVVWLGKVPQADLPALYHAAAVFIYPSFYEGFGLPVLEAMHQGTPVVTANTSSLPEVGGDAAMYCDPAQPIEMTRALWKMLRDVSARTALQERGRQRALEFTWERFMRKLLEALARSLGRREIGSTGYGGDAAAVA